MSAVRDLARDMRHALDPVAFAIECLGFVPDEWQERVLRSESKRLLLNCSRQAGKSTVTAVRALHRAVYRPGLILLVSPTDRQSALLFQKVANFLKRLDPGPGREVDNKRSFILANGAEVVCLPGSAETIRGYSAPKLVIEDEAAFVDDAVNIAVRPMLATSGGTLILMSTPNGKRGHFFERWTSGGDDWERISVKASECPRIDPAFLAAEKRDMGEAMFSQEYEGEFVDSIDAVFKTADIDRAITDDVQPLLLPSRDEYVSLA